MNFFHNRSIPNAFLLLIIWAGCVHSAEPYLQHNDQSDVSSLNTLESKNEFDPLTHSIRENEAPKVAASHQIDVPGSIDDDLFHQSLKVKQDKSPKSIYDLIQVQRIAEDEILEKWQNYLSELDDADNLLMKNRALAETVRDRLLEDIQIVHDNMLAESNWRILERQRQIVKSLIQIRYALNQLVSKELQSTFAGYGAMSVDSAKKDMLLLMVRAQVHIYWLLQTTIKTLADIVASPMSLLESLGLLCLYALLLRLFLKISEKYFLNPVTPSGYFSSVVFRWGAVLYKRFAYWVFLHYSLIAVYSNFPWPEFELAILLLNEVFFWYVVSAAVRYWTLSKASIKQLEPEAREHLLSLERYLLIYLAIFSVKNKLGEYLLGAGTIIAWIDQWLFVVLAMYCLLQLRRFHPILMLSVKRYVRLGSKQKRLLTFDGLLLPVSSLFAIALLLYQWVESRLVFYIRRNENARKLMAYWSRQEISRLSEKESHEEQVLLTGSDVEYFSAEYKPSKFVAYGEKELMQLEQLLFQEQRKFIAVVGGRGLGKTTLLNRLDHIEPERLTIKYVSCPNKASDIYAAIANTLGIKEYSEPEQLLTVLKKYPKSCICLDDCQRLMVPSIGGLDLFERLIELMRKAGGQVSWLMTFESPAWQFFSRVRGERVIFDKVLTLPSWNEYQMQQLIHNRNKEAGIKPDFSKLFLPSQQAQEWLVEDSDNDFEMGEQDVLEENALEGDKEEELSLSERKELAIKARAQMQSYVRVLWDFSGGNPRGALWAWRRSLYKNLEDGSIFVSLFNSMDQEEIEGLPNLMLFVLKTILQMEKATLDNISQATNLSAKETSDALRFLSGRQYLDIEGGQYCIAESWLRPVSVLLTRQHLLEST